MFIIIESDHIAYSSLRASWRRSSSKSSLMWSMKYRYTYFYCTILVSFTSIFETTSLWQL